MLWKLLLTALVVYLAYRTLRARSDGFRRATGSELLEGPSLPPKAIRVVAYALAGFMIGGAALYFFEGWRSGHQVIEIQVVNANTGAVTPFRARRRDIEGRSFRTLDGQVVRLADVERMILTETARAP